MHLTVIKLPLGWIHFSPKDESKKLQVVYSFVVHRSKVKQNKTTKRTGKRKGKDLTNGRLGWKERLFYY
jgi:hypothetical protein